MMVSLFNNLCTYAGNINTTEVLHQIKIGTVKAHTDTLREFLSVGNTALYDEHKKLLPAFTPSATFNQRRKVEHLDTYNGNIILDIDDLTPSLLSHARQKAIECSHTFACFISPGAQGLKIIVKTNATPDTHKQVFNSIANHYEKELNMFIDESGKDIPRLCFFSFDPALFLNLESSVYTV